MKYTVKADLRHDQLGRLRAGQVIEATDLQASAILEWLEPYDTKVVQERPKQPADGALLSASPAVQVSQQQTAKLSNRGGRRKKAEA